MATLYSRNGYQLEQPNIDHSTGALPGQHNRAVSRSRMLELWHVTDAVARNESITPLRRITIRDVEFDSIETYLIVGSRRANDPDNVISCKSSLVVTILKKSMGALVNVARRRVAIENSFAQFDKVENAQSRILIDLTEQFAEKITATAKEKGIIFVDGLTFANVLARHRV